MIKLLNFLCSKLRPLHKGLDFEIGFALSTDASQRSDYVLAITLLQIPEHAIVGKEVRISDRRPIAKPTQIFKK